MRARPSHTGSVCCSPSTCRSASTGSLYPCCTITSCRSRPCVFRPGWASWWGSHWRCWRDTAPREWPADCDRSRRAGSRWGSWAPSCSSSMRRRHCRSGTRRGHPPQIYSDLVRDRGDSPTAVLFEFPTGLIEDAAYAYYSTFHWQWLVNGYSGFFPPSYLPAGQSGAELSRRTVARRDQIARSAISGDSRRVSARRSLQDADPSTRPAERSDAGLEASVVHLDKHAEISLYRFKFNYSDAR